MRNSVIVSCSNSQCLQARKTLKPSLRQGGEVVQFQVALVGVVFPMSRARAERSKGGTLAGDLYFPCLCSVRDTPVLALSRDTWGYASCPVVQRS